MYTKIDNRSVFHFFWQCIKPYKLYYLIVGLTPILCCIGWPLFNYYVKILVENLSNLSEFKLKYIVYPLSSLIITELLLHITFRTCDYVTYKSEPLIKKNIISLAFGHLQFQDYSFFQDTSTGNLTSRIQQFISEYKTLFNAFYGGLFFSILQLITNFIVFWTVNTKIGILSLCWFFLYWIIVFIFAKKLIPSSINEANALSNSISYLSDRFTNIQSIFAFGTRKKEYKNLNKQIENDLVPAQRNLLGFEFVFNISISIISLLFFISITILSIFLRHKNVITIGDFVFIITTILTCVHFMWNCTINLNNFIIAIGEVKSAFTILQNPLKYTNDNEKDIKIKKGLIKFENVDFAYETNIPIFENFNLEIPSGQKIGIIGKSGQGKSTLIKLLLRYFKPQSGKITIDGHELVEFEEEFLRQQISLIPQETLLFHRSIKENIAYAKESATEEEVIEASIQAQLHEFILTLPKKYDTIVGELGTKLSGGQRQRIAIARAFLKKAPILILDEATSALDSQTENQIQASLSKLVNNRSTTVIAIAHRLSTLKIMDKIIVIENGKILEEGSHEQLLKEKGYYFKRWQEQISLI